MNCSQILPGAVNLEPCSLATGYCSGNPFIVYASGTDVIILDGHLQHLQTIFGKTCGYGNTRVSCLHCAENVGRLVVAWGAEVVIFEPSMLEDMSGSDNKEQTFGLERAFLAEWNAVQTLSLETVVSSICWNREGSHFLTGGATLTLWEYSSPLPSLSVPDIKEEEEGEEEEEEEEEGLEMKTAEELKKPPAESEEVGKGTLKEIWSSDVPSPVVHLSFSPNGELFATCGEDDCLVKIWYPVSTGGVGIGSPPSYSYCYVAHPRSVRGFVWRRVTSSLPKGCIPNVLLTHCMDNICRLWSHSLKKGGCLRFFIAASIDPVADIPFRTTMPLEDQPFIVHWLNNKETTLTSKVEKYQKGLSRPMSRYASVQSFASSINEEILQSWVCIDEGDEPEEPLGQHFSGVATPVRSEVELSEMARQHPPQSSLSSMRKSHSLASYLSPHGGSRDRPGSAGGLKTPSPLGLAARSKVSVQQKRALAHLLDEWYSTPDLLLCIHPTVGSLMVWTVEGLDAPPNLERLVHVSFSSCLPHIFPPHLSQSLRRELLQFLVREPDVLHTREATAEGGGAGRTDISLPVPQIRLSSSGSMSAMSHLEVPEDVRKIKSDTTLVIVSSHTNGSLNTWSVELTIQSNYCTSIAGLLHCAGTGGHASKVKKIHRHPWLPILMSISSRDGAGGVVSSQEGSGQSSGGVSELIIWNADLPGPLQHKSKLNELSRIVSPSVQSFDHVTWVPPISVGEMNEGALARCPCSGLFVANVGTNLVLFQASLYTVTKPQPSSFMTDKDNERTNEQLDSSYRSDDIHITSQLGMKGVSVVEMVGSLAEFENIVDLHAFRMCSLVTSLDLKECTSEDDFGKDMVLVLVENRRPQDSARKTSDSGVSPGSKGIKSYVHLWRVTISNKSCDASPLYSTQADSSSGKTNHYHSSQDFVASVRKVYSSPFPLPMGTCVVDTSPACDISSSLQLQTPTLSAPFLFATSCSDGTIRCWQFSLKPKSHLSGHLTPTGEGCGSGMEFKFYEVFGSNSSVMEPKMRPTLLDCYEEELIKSLPIQSYVPSGFKMAYPGRLAMAHLLSKPIKSSLHRDSLSSSFPSHPSQTSIVKGLNPLDRYAVVTVWECESSGGLKWACEASLMLVGLAQLGSQGSEVGVLMEWLPMENGAYLLATCFALTISIFGMSLPRDEEQFKVHDKRVGFNPRERTTVLSKVKSQASWVCLLQFPCFRASLDRSITCLTYTGSNSIMVSTGSEIDLYSCWVHGDDLVSFTPSEKERQKLSKGPFSRNFIQDGSSKAELAETEVVNLLDYAHARNTPLPQYHPRILMELMNSGKLRAVKSILINLLKYLLLYRSRKTTTTELESKSYFDRGGMEDIYKEENQEKKSRLVLSASGFLQRAKPAKPKKVVESIPHLSLAKMGIVRPKGMDVAEDTDAGEAAMELQDDYDELFTLGGGMADDLRLDFDEEDAEIEMDFTDLKPEKDEFTPKLSELLDTILSEHQLADLGDLEQIQLLTIAKTVASTKMGLSENGGLLEDSSMDTSTTSSVPSVGMSLASLSGAGYASAGGTKGWEAMDDCGLRYLLALENYITLSDCLPKDLSPGPLPPSVLVWAFHSDAETELLAAIPCVQRNELKWEELRNAGVGWWLRSLDTLRRLVEKLAKAQFMKNQEPLDASLFYLAMKKQSLLKGLFRSVGDTKKTSFFSNNFAEDSWKNKAQKNAFVLLGKQRFEEAAAFFLLADKLWDAVEVCVSNLNDFQLAFVVIRLYEGDHGPIYQRFLREYILGVQSSPSGGEKKKVGGVARLETNPDPFLRSMVCWLLQDCSGALETLLVNPELSKGGTDPALNTFRTNPGIFNFYLYLRTHPFLIRRDHKAVSTASFGSTPFSGHKAPKSERLLSGVGDEPLTALERSMLFGTAYYHLCHGCPLLALNVLSRLPNSSKLGKDISNVLSDTDGGVADMSATTSAPGAESFSGMIESGTLDDSFARNGAVGERAEPEDDFDWGAPVSSQLDSRYGQPEDEEEELDWSKPLTSRFSGSEEIDWSQPFTRRFSLDTPTLSPPDLASTSIDTLLDKTNHTSTSSSQDSSTSLTTRGLFVLSLADQLQYNACLSIVTEELHSIYLPACCQYLWSTKGRAGLPILPLPKQSVDPGLSLVQHYGKNTFDRTVQSLRGVLTDWLRGETGTVKEICWVDSPDYTQGKGVGGEGAESADEGGDHEEGYVVNYLKTSAPAGYDLLTTLMNYASLHAATSPSLLTVKFELMHLMNSMLPWSTGVDPAHNLSLRAGDTPLDLVPVCAVDPSQLPILTSCSLPVRHLTNLATHLRLLSGCIVEVLTEHTYPPISSQPLPQVGKIYELCCAISHCMTVSLNPILHTDLSPPSLDCPDTPMPSRTALTSSADSLGRTPTPSSTMVADLKQREAKASHSPLLRPRVDSFNSPDAAIGMPNSKPSKWPGVPNWPGSLTSDEGHDPTPLSVVLVECVISVYLGLFATAWSRHAIDDLLALLKNGPNMDMWYSVMGGGVDAKKNDRTLSKSLLTQTLESMSKRFRRAKHTTPSPSSLEEEGTAGVFMAPKKTLLDHFLSSPHEVVREKRVRKGEPGGFLMVDQLDEEESEEEGDSEVEEMFGIGGISFQVGGEQDYSETLESSAETSPANPNCFAWCLMNVCIAKLLQQLVRGMVSGVGLELLELITVSPLLYSTLKILDEWESIFTRRLEALGEAPNDLFGPSDDIETSKFRMGLSLMRHKFVLEPENSPFRAKDRASRNAKKLWQHLVHDDESRETIIHYIFVNKAHSGVTTPLGSLGGPDAEDTDAPQEPSCKVIHKEHDNTISAFCLNSCSRAQVTMLALALPREVVEIEVPDNSMLVESGSTENMSDMAGPAYSPKRTMSLAPKSEDYIMVQAMHRPKTGSFTAAQIKRSLGSLPGITSTPASTSPNLAHGQTGTNASLLIRRPTVGVKKMAPHPSLSYYLTGSLDGSVTMWEFGTPRSVATQRSPGMGGGVTKIRFTPEGNKFGVTDSSGKLSLWQGIQTSNKAAYHILHTSMKYLSDFLFLGSSSFIATCGDSTEGRNLYLWDTLMPTNRSIVKEFSCNEGGATALGYSSTKQRLFCGGKKGEVYIFDIRQFSLLHCITAHSSSTINCIAVNDIDGYFVTGASDGDIKVIDNSTLLELAHFPGQHSKSRLFRHGEGGVTDLDIMPGGKLYSCGADGSIKCQTLKL